VVLFVDVKKARDLPGEDQNGLLYYMLLIFHINLLLLTKGLSDPYCKVSVVYTPSNPDDTNGLISNLQSISPPSTPTLSRHASLFSCASSSRMSIKKSFPQNFLFLLASKIKMKSRLSFLSRRSSKSSIRRRSSLGSIGNGKVLSTVTYRTAIRPKTINPEWNEHFEL
jgi:hypothetical protein